MKVQELVSIIVITYNSSEYVLETLESAKAQTYQNIELIISDDCSKDNTVELCQKWLDKNKDRFVRVELITTKKNTGISANCNRGVKNARGSWVKSIAGDDVLLPNCIYDFVEFTQQYHECKLIHSRILIYKNTFDEINLIGENKINEIFMDSKYTSGDQFSILLMRNQVMAPTVFINKQVLLDIGGFDESIPLCEDYPMWLNLTKKGFKFYFLNKVTVKYRLHDSSISQPKNQIFSSGAIKVEADVYNKWIKPDATKIIRFLQEYMTCLKEAIDFFKMNNRSNRFYRLIFRILKKPFVFYYKRLNKKIIKRRSI